MELYSLYSCFEKMYNYVIQHHLLKIAIFLLLHSAIFVINDTYVYLLFVSELFTLFH